MIISNGCIMLYSLAVVFLWHHLFVLCGCAALLFFGLWKNKRAASGEVQKRVKEKTTEGQMCAGCAIAKSTNL